LKFGWWSHQNEEIEMKGNQRFKDVEYYIIMVKFITGKLRKSRE